MKTVECVKCEAPGVSVASKTGLCSACLLRTCKCGTKFKYEPGRYQCGKCLRAYNWKQRRLREREAM
jgi:hypothetical protein